MHDLQNDNLKIIVLEMKKPNSKPFLLSTWYRPPPKSPAENFQYFESVLEKADSKYSEIYRLGDFNCNFSFEPSGDTYFAPVGCVD